MASIIDKLPGRDLIDKLKLTGDFVYLEELFWLRAKWSGGYPLRHIRMSTSGIFDDFIHDIDNVHRYKLILLMATFTKNVPDKYFHVALFLLGNLIPIDEIGERPDGFSDLVLAIRLRVEKLSFISNLTCAWDALALHQRYLKSENDFLRQYSPHKLEVHRYSWKRFFKYPLLNYQNRIYKECYIDMKWVKKQLRELYQPPGLCKLIYVAKIEATHYWVWRLPGRIDSAHLNRMAYLKIAEDGTHEINYWDLYEQFNERYSAEQISTRLLNIEFTP
jgi:hypothetical protein